MVMLSTRLYRTSSRRSFLCLPFASSPRHRLVNVFIAAFEHHDFGHRICHTQLFHLCNFCFCCGNDCFQIIIHLLAAPVFVTTPPKYLLLMEMVRFNRFPRVLARSEFIRSTSSSQVMTPFVLKRHLVQNEVADSVYAEQVYQIVRVDHVSFGFTHLAVALQQPR